jgi:glutamate-1-semialdehyde 2,1-aminomutase
MPFRRLFGRASEPPPADTEAPETDDSEDVAPDEGDVLPEQDADAAALEASWGQRAGDVIPGGSSTGSKRREGLYGSDSAVGPTHFIRAAGCHVVTVAEQTLIDCTMALGSVAIGYADESVTRAVLAAMANGHVSGLAHQSEVEVAERLCEMIPCAEQVRFLKSGAEAVSAAVRIARTATSRSHVVACGYLGWHDWASTAAGVPAAARQDITVVPFDDVAALEAACRESGKDLAAVLIEPVIERLPSETWIAAARRLTSELGAVLVFDEMKTGFRLRPGGYQELSGVGPDLATFGKAMANGFPIAAVVGRAAVMDAARHTWISSTLAGESASLAAVHAVLDRFDTEDVCAALGTIGASMRDAVSAAITASGISGVSVEGLDAMWLLRFEDADIQQHFIERGAAHGALFKRGAYNFASLAHGDDEVLVEIEHIASSAFVDLMESDT